MRCYISLSPTHTHPLSLALSLALYAYLNQIRMLIKLFQFEAVGCQVLWSRATTH